MTDSKGFNWKGFLDQNLWCKAYFIFNKLTQLDDYLKGTAGCGLYYGQYKFFLYGENICAVKNNSVFCIKSRHNDCFTKGGKSISHSNVDEMLKNSDAIAGVIVDEKNGLRETKILINNDEGNCGDDSLNEYFKKQSPIISFSCLDKFFKNSSIASRFSSGKLKIIDYKPHERIPFSKEEEKKYLKHLKSGDSVYIRDKVSPPKNGLYLNFSFDIKECYWYYLESVLFYEEGGFCYLMSKDNNASFGFEISFGLDSKFPNTVQEAFDALTPELAIGRDFRREIDWFMIRSNVSEVPDHKDCIACEDDTIHLPCDGLEDPYLVSSRDIRVGKDGFVYANNPMFGIYERFIGDGWYTFRKSNAIRSFLVAD